MDTTDEQSIIHSCQTQDLREFARLYDRYHEPIYRYVYFRVFDRATAEDLTSQTFLKALEKIRTYDPQRGAFGAWLYRIARNTVFDHLRALRPTSDLAEAEDLPADDDVAKRAGGRVELAKIRTALASLDPLKRDIVLLRLWDGLSYAEIAAIVGKSEGNCKVMFSRTVQGLRIKLGPALFLFLLALPHSL
jgi:RNA polymerase sigma-70 factor (ECF subfamily)